MISARPVRGPLDIRRRSLDIFDRLTAQVLMMPDTLTKPSRFWVPSIRSSGLDQGELGDLTQVGHDVIQVVGRDVDGGADGCGTHVDDAHIFGSLVQPLDVPLDGAGIGVELLAQTDGHGVLQLGTAHLHHVVKLLGFDLQSLVQAVELAAGQRAAGPEWSACRRWGYTSLVDWAMLTWSLGWTME